MAGLKGHVDRFDSMLAAGWALDKDDPAAAPEVEIVQGGRAVACLTPCFEALTLRDRLGLPAFDGPPLYAFRLWLPLAAGVRPDEPTTFRFRATGAPLANGAARTVRLAAHVDPDALADVGRTVFQRLIAALEPDAVAVELALSAPHGFVPEATLDGRALPVRPAGETTLIGEPRDSYAAVFRVEREELLAAEGTAATIAVSGPPGDRRCALHAGLRTLRLPKTLLDLTRRIAPIPGEAHIGRVAKESIDPSAGFLAGGATVFGRLEATVAHFAGRPLHELDRIVDWGAGCARVTRCFWEVAERPPAGEVVGVDIDEVNVDWCRRHMGGHGRYELLALDGFALDAGSVDLVFGLSVMTHLTERHQFLWLEEIRRVLKPGGLALLTFHGEYMTYRSPGLQALPYVDRLGFFDGTPDGAIGADRDHYYRAIFQARGHVRRNWGALFEILDVIPAWNGQQDCVVLRKA